MFSDVKYITWHKEARKITVPTDTMKSLIQRIQAKRKRSKSKTKREDFTEETYALDQHGDYYELYYFHDGRYYIISSNDKDESKNSKKRILRPDKVFDRKFTELNDFSLRRAFGFVPKEFKRCIPKQFYYINPLYVGKKLKASSIDVSSQYPSGCYGKMPNYHTARTVEGEVEPTEEYPFAFYVESGTLAIYKELDTREWMSSRYFTWLYRIGKGEDYPFVPSPKNPRTVLMKASQYTMDSTWDYFYRKKMSLEKDTEEYDEAKLVMNGTIGCWHRKDRAQKRIMDYDDGGSFQLAHLVAVAIARGNQKILNKMKEIGENRIIHVVVDGIIYGGKTNYSDVGDEDRHSIGKFHLDFLDCDFMMLGMNLYAAEKDGEPVKFRHAGMDLLDGKKIDDSEPHGIKDLKRLTAKERIKEIING